VLEDGAVVGRIFLSPAAPQDRRWMWQAVTTTRYPARRTATSHARGRDGGIR